MTLLNTGNAKWGQYQALIAAGWGMLRYFIDVVTTEKTRRQSALAPAHLFKELMNAYA
jgi:hypothetical protein